MFQKKILPILLALSAVVFIPTVALAQTNDTSLYEDWTYSDYDWSDSYYDDTDSYDYEYSMDDFTDASVAMAATSAFLAVWGLIMAPIILGTYIYTSIAYMKIAKTLNHPNPWYAWVPVLRGIQRFQLADMSGWFVLLMIISPVNLILSIIALMKICEKRGIDKLLALLALIPAASFVLIGILAWKKDVSATVSEAPVQATTPPVTE